VRATPTRTGTSRFLEDTGIGTDAGAATVPGPTVRRAAACETLVRAVTARDEALGGLAARAAFGAAD
jgi:hypothetical protein